MKKYLIQIPIFVGLCILVLFTFNNLKHEPAIKVDPKADNRITEKVTTSNTTVSEPTSLKETTSPDTTITLSFIGDCLCATDENAYYENTLDRKSVV